MLPCLALRQTRPPLPREHSCRRWQLDPSTGSPCRGWAPLPARRYLLLVSVLRKPCPLSDRMLILAGP